MRQLKISKQITNRETQSLDKYLQEIGKLGLITAEEEVNLARRIRGGDLIAVEKLTKANLRFVVSVAKQYQNYGLTLGDLINEGNLGLIKAAKRFDETRGFKFISYAVWWIRQSIMQSLAEQSRIVRLPLNRVSGLNKLLKTFSVLEQEYQRDPTTDELAQAMGVNAEEIAQNQQYSGRHVSVDAPFHEGEENSLLDIIADTKYEMPDSELLSDSLKTEIQRALSTLTARECEVMTLYFGLDGNAPMTLEELGDRLHLTRERVRQIKEKATRRLRYSSRHRSLKSFLG
ncbi:RNA polymerase sigma factor RpoD/SigA [Fulvivirgaceae bacterium PWU4]|uniref:RNA polymerase sigma factor RpoD/SigA n=1 Tax=Chryseosolibacter histidini TaxID=2782349 RepID=A0AAP2DTS4_9BACT|nr:RNA polymerase sigma factor RpoD/SigA [Chryseosolibacter histidini]MBT1701203.1 RNA polymerase sigma factor RpoD/SigA [Chryseosolibacter histidini]